MLSAKTNNGFVYFGRRKKGLKTIDLLFSSVPIPPPNCINSKKARKNSLTAAELGSGVDKQTNTCLISPRPTVFNLALHFYVVLWKHPDAFEDEVVSQVVTTERFSEHFLSIEQNEKFISL